LVAATVYVVNNMDQPVRYRIKGNVSATTQGAVQVGSDRNVGAGGVDAVTLTPETSGYLPVLYLEFQCDTAPASGSVTAWLALAPDRIYPLARNLAIRDTYLHDPSSDPTSIFYVNWSQ